MNPFQTVYQFRTSLVPIVQGADTDSDVAVRIFFSFRNPYQAAKEAVSLDSKNASAHLSLGWAQIRLGQLGEAVDSPQRSINLDPNNYLSHNNLGYGLLIDGTLPIGHFIAR